MSSPQQEDQKNGSAAAEQQENESAQGYEEMDLTPYEEDDDATLHKKLVAAKMARKRAEEDLKLLCNRIGLLKQEEGKAVRKIDETRKRANDILYQRRRNIDVNQDRQSREQQRLTEQAIKTQTNQVVKQTKEQAINRSAQQNNYVKKADANATYNDKQMNRQIWDDNKKSEEQRAQNIKAQIHTQRQIAAHHRANDFVDRQVKTRTQIEGKLQREAYEQNLYESEIQRMEKEELDLIMRLKNTRLIEEQAHFHLESAKTDPIVPSRADASGDAAGRASASTNKAKAKPKK